MAIGANALSNNTNGSSNLAIGFNSLSSNTTGDTNVAIGENSLAANTTGATNMAIGSYSLSLNTTGSFNMSNGLGALEINDTGSYNIAIGYNSLSSNTTGDNNLAIGPNSLSSNTTGTNNTALGAATDVASGALTNCTMFGYEASCNASNQVTIGNSAVTVLRCQATTITSLSDRRDKKDIENLESSLEFVEQLKPVRFNWNMRNGVKVDIPEIGFIAQDLQQVQLDTGIKIPNLVYDVNPEKLEASYGALLPLLVKSIQELSQDNKRLHAQIQELTAKITE